MKNKIYVLINFFKNKLSGGFSYFWSFKYIRIFSFLIFVLNFLIWYFAYFIIVNVGQNLVILHYNVDFGVDLVGNANKIFIIPFLGLVIFFINIILLFNFFNFKNFKFISYSLLLSSLFVNLLLLFSLASIYLINFR